jgi:hypothetical protein
VERRNVLEAWVKLEHAREKAKESTAKHEE